MASSALVNGDDVVADNLSDDLSDETLSKDTVKSDVINKNAVNKPPDDDAVNNTDEETDNGVYCDESSGVDSNSGRAQSPTDDLAYGLPVRETNPSLPDTVQVLDGPFGGKVYLVGTAHFSEESQRDVEETIRKTQPNIVVLELCDSRLSILSLDEKTILEESQSMDLSKMRRHVREYGVVQGVMYLLLLSLSSHLTKELGMAPGGEFRRAFREAKKVPGCVIHLGDRPVHVTLRRAISSLSFWQKLKLGFGIIFNNESISKEEVEKCKQRDLLEELLKEMTGEFPALSEVFVNERDVYLTYSLQLASSPIPCMEARTGYIPSTVVGIVGIGHLPGIVKNWGKVKDSDIPALLTVPPPSLMSIVIKKSIKYSTLGLILWGCYKLVPSSVTEKLSTLTTSSIEYVQEKTWTPK